MNNYKYIAKFISKGSGEVKTYYLREEKDLQEVKGENDYNSYWKINDLESPVFHYHMYDLILDRENIFIGGNNE